jgi:hypothetical protein
VYQSRVYTPGGGERMCLKPSRAEKENLCTGVVCISLVGENVCV